MEAIYLSIKRRSFSRKQTNDQKVKLFVIIVSIVIVSFFSVSLCFAMLVALLVFNVVRWIHLGVFRLKENTIFSLALIYSFSITLISKIYKLLYINIFEKIKSINFFPEFPYNEQTLTRSITQNEINSRDTFWGPKMPKRFLSPNSLTIVRAIGAIVLAVYHDMNVLIFASAVIGLALTDLFDGVIARTQDRETTFGKWADPIADRMLFLSAALFLYYKNPEFWESVGFRIIVPEAMLVIFGLAVFFCKGSIIPRAIFWGRLKFVFYLFSVLAIIFSRFAIAEISINIGCVLSFVAFFCYATRFYRETYNKSIFNGIFDWFVKNSTRIQYELVNHET